MMRVAPHLRYRIVPYVALLLAFGAIFSWTSWQSVRERELKSLSVLAEIGEKSLDTYFVQIESALRVLSEEIREPGGEVDLERADIALKRFKQAYPDMRIVIVTRMDGQIIASSENAPNAKLPTLAGEPSFVLSRDELSKGATLSVGRPFLGSISKQWIIPLRYGARDSKGNLLFLVGAGLPLSKPQSFWKDAPLPVGAALAILRDDGFLVNRYPVPPQIELARVYGKSLAGGPVMSVLEKQKFPASGTVEGRSGVTGVNTVFVFRRLSHYPLTFTVTNPMENIRAVWWQEVRFSYLLMLALGVGGIFVYLHTSRRQAAWEKEREQRVKELEKANTELGESIYRLKLTQADLIRAEKLAALGALVAGVAHEINTPIGNALMVASTLREKSGHFAAQIQSGTLRRSMLDEYTGTITQGSELLMRNLGQAADLVSSFKQVAVDQSSAQRRGFDLKEMIEEVLSTLHHLVRSKPIRVVTHLAEGVQMDSYPGPLGQVLNNLFNNALIHGLAGREGGEIVIETRREREDRVVLEVRDDGSGIAEENLGKVFDPFFTTRLGQGGSGLGLNIVHNIVTQLLGGRITVESPPGRGATFKVVLPLIAPASNAVSDIGEPARSRRQSVR